MAGDYPGLPNWNYGLHVDPETILALFGGTPQGKALRAATANKESMTRRQDAETKTEDTTRSAKLQDLIATTAGRNQEVEKSKFLTPLLGKQYQAETENLGAKTATEREMLPFQKEASKAMAGYHTAAGEADTSRALSEAAQVENTRQQMRDMNQSRIDAANEKVKTDTIRAQEKKLDDVRQLLMYGSTLGLNPNDLQQLQQVIREGYGIKAEASNPQAEADKRMLLGERDRVMAKPQNTQPDSWDQVLQRIKLGVQSQEQPGLGILNNLPQMSGSGGAPDVAPAIPTKGELQNQPPIPQKQTGYIPGETQVDKFTDEQLAELGMTQEQRAKKKLQELLNRQRGY